MAIIKCKMCGGDIEISADKTFGTCEYCGCTMTLPKIDDEQRAAAFNRGNHFRRIGEFDKALAVYEHIVSEDDNDAEAHWCCALCRFGIEYVEDPATYEWLPTCHRASFDSILEDVDYLAALEHSDGLTRRQYQKDAAKIAEVQKGILATSQSEEPFDVFVCYKESDGDGERTRDSMLAQDIYYQLTDAGYRVFFSRITLEDKGGAQYEPYIFAALNSAKVMVVVGTSAEHLNAVWVKNEWSRFLALMKKDRSKVLLPCYRDMDPYDMPDQLNVLQSYDMGKIGFIQDLIRGIKKIVQKDEPKQTVVKETVVTNTVAAASNTAPLLKRVFIFLEDGDWNSADEYCEKVLDIDPENAQAYLGKLMAELRVKKQSGLKNCKEPFDSSNNYQKVLRYGDKELSSTLKEYIDHINARNENVRLENHYRKAVEAMEEAGDERAYKRAAELFAPILKFKDSETLRGQCLEKAEESRKDVIYASAMKAMNQDTLDGYTSAKEEFEEITGWRDTDDLIRECDEKIEILKASAEAARLERERREEAIRLKKERRNAWAKGKRKGLLFFMIVNLIVGGFFVLIGILAKSPAMVVSLGGFFGTYATMFYIWSKSPKGNPHILGKAAGIKKPLFVLLCIVASFVVFFAGIIILVPDSSEPVQEEEEQQVEEPVAESEVLTGKHAFSGMIKVDGLSCYLELENAVSYKDPLDEVPIITTELWLSEDDALTFKGYNGLTVTLEGELFNYRGGGSLMFNGTPSVLGVSGTPNIKKTDGTYPNWESTDNETKFWAAMEVLEMVVYQCEGVWDVRTLCDSADLARIKTEGFSIEPVMLSINDNWVSDSGYGTYLTPEEDCVCIGVGSYEAPSTPIWKYSWDGKLISGDGTLEEYLVSEGLVR